MGDNGVPAAARAFRSLAGHLVTGVSVIVALVDGEPLATTASSVVAASWDPPLLAVFCGRGSRLDAALAASGRFTVNVLGEADHGLARRFARAERGSGWAALADVPLRRRDPFPPALLTALAWVDCAVTHAIPTGDHRCSIGTVLDMDRTDALSPLAYYRGRFRGLSPSVAPDPWATENGIDLATIW